MTPIYFSILFLFSGHIHYGNILYSESSIAAFFCMIQNIAGTILFFFRVIKSDFAEFCPAQLEKQA